MNAMLEPTKICVVGLGYVGLPLAMALADRFDVVGFDINTDRINELKNGYDRTNEITKDELLSTRLLPTTSIDDIANQDIYIVTVPTPVDQRNKPDLTAVLHSCETIGKVLKKDSIVVFESTVYPGVTEDLCGPELEKHSGLKCGSDFYLGYSPERINPGDKKHTVDQITKVVAGQTPEVARVLAEIYGATNKGNVHITPNIKTAEAAKVIENAQRDINIAFINEVSLIFKKLGLNTYDVLEASQTKWNFLPFRPGLVGGHCIGVDPYYLAHCARQLGHNPEIILSGRRINDSMGSVIAEQIAEELKTVLDYGHKARILVLGLTFKENIPDLRNTKVNDLISALSDRGHDVSVHDPYANPDEAKKYYDIDLMSSLEEVEPFDCLVGAVPHKEYVRFSNDCISNIVRQGGVVADLKGMWRQLTMPEKVKFWQM
jgi:UDP-N-acetyl-D-glucosamine/UDP-N-acetyl-D-galactosamine dehydrogenase